MTQVKALQVGLLTWAYPPEKSGLTRAAREIAQSLVQDGHHVGVFMMDRGGRSAEGAVEVIGCGLEPGSIAARWRKFAAIGHLAAPLAFRRAVLAEHSRMRFSVIEGTNWCAPGLLIATLSPMPFVTRSSTPAATSAAGAAGTSIARASMRCWRRSPSCGRKRRRNLPSFRMTIIGARDAAFAHLPAAARSRLRTFHRAVQDALHDLLATADVVVAPSRYESFGLVYQEAMMFGRPIVACAEGPSARLFVGASGAGVLATRCDGAVLADVMRRVIRDPALRVELATASRASSGRFTCETLGRETAAAYRTAI